MDYVWIIQINCFCSLILGIILYSLLRNYDRQMKQRYFMLTIVMGILACLADVNWSLIQGHYIAEPPLLNFITNGIYCISSTIMSYFWFCYVETALGTKIFRKRLFRTIMALPILIVAIGVVLSYFNGIFFYIDENNIYHRGPLILVHTVSCFLFTLLTSVHALIKALTIKNYLKSVEYRILSMFLLFLLLIGLIQILFPKIPTLSMGFTLAFLFVYIDLQNLLVTVDSLSGLNNKNHLIRFLSTRLKNEFENENLYLFILDINDLKKINDTYGHLEGDNALIHCAEALKLAAKDGSNFIGRYSGDEFIVAADVSDADEIEEKCQKMNDALMYICKLKKLPYLLTFCIGYAHYDSSMKSIQAFIAEADKNLIEAKKRRDGLII